MLYPQVPAAFPFPPSMTFVRLWEAAPEAGRDPTSLPPSRR